jgi:hypothetical protein
VVRCYIDEVKILIIEFGICKVKDWARVCFDRDAAVLVFICVYEYLAKCLEEPMLLLCSVVSFYAKAQ